MMETMPAKWDSRDIRALIDLVAEAYGLLPIEITGSLRHPRLFGARMAVVWLARRHANVSFPSLGRQLGHRHHTTVLHASQKADGLRLTDPEFLRTLDALDAKAASILRSRSAYAA